MSQELRHAVEPDGFVFTLSETRLLSRKGRNVAVEHWADLRHPGIEHLLLLRDNEAAEAAGEGLRVAHETIASMPPGDLALLGLPPPCARAMRLSERGALSDERFAVDVAWLDREGRLAHAPKRVGAAVTIGSETSVLLNPRFLVAEAAAELNASPPGREQAALDERLKRMAVLKRALLAATGDVEAADYLKRLTIYHASGIGIDPTEGDDAAPIVPRLLGDVPPRSAAVADNEDIEPERAPLLPREHARTFETMFPREGGRSHYRLARGCYAVAEPAVAAALSVVARVNAAGARERRAFRAAPRDYLLPAMEDKGGVGDMVVVAALPASDFGERVLGVGEATIQGLPWAKGDSREWFPDAEEGGSFFIASTNGDPIPVVADQVASLRDALAAAQAAGQTVVRFAERELPVAEVARVLDKVIGQEAPEPAPRDAPVPDPVAKDAQLTLLVHRNEESRTFEARLRDPATRATGRDAGLLQATLHPHQEQAVAWLQAAWRCGMPGVLLADDMGLGKTFEVLAFLAWLRGDRAASRRPFLFVAPVKLLDEWQEQIAKHLATGALGSPILAYGHQLRELRVRKERESAIGRQSLDLRRMQAADWILTTYETVRDHEFSFAQLDIKVAIVDEAQKVKSPTSQVNKAVLSLKPDFTILMTGTPVEHGPLDLWTLLDICWPGFLEATGRDFVARYSHADAGALAELKERLIRPRELGGRDCAPIMLRRFKSEVLSGLPARRESVVEEVMPEVQVRAVDALIGRAHDECWEPLKTLSALRSVTLHPEMDVVAGPKDEARLIGMSARFVAAFRILDQIKQSREAVLIFVEFIKAQGLLRNLIEQRYGLRADIINGETAASRVGEIKARFQDSSGFNVLILGPKAAGFGLTLTAANHVIHLSRWWNPAVEDQCSDRVYRIGQTRDVTIHVPLAIHPRHGERSFDRVLDGLLREKRALSRDIVVPTGLGEMELQRLHAMVTGSAPPDRDGLRELDELTWKQFEDWTAGQLKTAGFEVSCTPRIGDQGCDVIARAPGRVVLAQCKHRRRAGAAVDDGAVSDLVRAQGRYAQTEGALLLGVTNGEFGLAARHRAAECGAALVDRSRILQLPRLAEYWGKAGRFPASDRDTQV